jgi:hypothetical protein
MTELLTPRLHCSPLQQDDWSFFSLCSRDPQVMLYIADSRRCLKYARPSIRVFHRGRQGQNSGCAWWCATGTRIPLGLTGYLHHEAVAPKWAFYFPGRAGRGYGYESLRAL